MDLPHRRSGGMFEVSDYEYLDFESKKHTLNFNRARL